MPKTITRRDVLKFTGGGILGIMLSPLPWKLLDDSAIWTQNWSLTPKLPHGPITAAFSHCTLCNGGCAIQAQSVSGMPYYVSGVRHHPFTHGILCTRGLAGHHMAHHPLRIVHSHRFIGKSDDGGLVAVSLKDALDEIARQMTESDGTVAILDQQPGRAISDIYQEFLNNVKNGLYLSNPSREDGTLLALQQMLRRPSASYGFDFENTSLILSFGAPLLDGWGTPGRMMAVRNSRSTKFIQIDSRYSRTAMQSDEWIALKPGTEEVLALSMANVLVREGRIPKQIRSSAIDFVQFKKIVEKFHPEQTASITGIRPETVVKIAREIVGAQSAIILSGADPGGGPLDPETTKAISSLNLLIGSVGKKGGIVSRNEIPGYATKKQPVRWTDVPDHSINVLIVDGSESGYALPWRLIEKKLNSEKNFIVSLSPVLDELSAHSDYLIPAPAYLESLSDVPASGGNTVASFALSTPLLKKPEGTTEPAETMKELAQRMNISLDIPTSEGVLKKKAETIHSLKRGSIYTYADQTSANVSEFPTSDEMWTKLTEGAIWIDEPARQSPPSKFSFALFPDVIDRNGAQELQLIAFGWKGATSAAQISPVLSKVFQESGLRDMNGIVALNPETAKRLGILNNEKALLTTRNGSQNVTVALRTSVRPGTVEASVGPLPNGTQTPAHPAGTNILNLCEVTDDGTWRITAANLLKA